jgi:hypothetical protein
MPRCRSVCSPARERILESIEEERVVADTASVAVFYRGICLFRLGNLRQSGSNPKWRVPEYHLEQPRRLRLQYSRADVRFYCDRLVGELQFYGDLR